MEDRKGTEPHIYNTKTQDTSVIDRWIHISIYFHAHVTQCHSRTSPASPHGILDLDLDLDMGMGRGNPWEWGVTRYDEVGLVGPNKHYGNVLYVSQQRTNSRGTYLPNLFFTGVFTYNRSCVCEF